MAREPDQRYATAAAMAEDLRRFVEDRPIRARGASLATALCHQGRWVEARTWLDQAEDWVRTRAHSRDWSHFPSPADFPNPTWWDLLIALNEAQSLILDHDFPADPFAH